MQALRSISLWFGIALLTSAMYVVGLPLFLLSMPFDPQRRLGHWYAQRWGRAILRLNSRWSFEVIGAERIPHDRPFVVVANHQGMGDILLAFCLDLHFKWISKAANFYVPCMGWFMYHAGYIPLQRGGKSSILKCMARAREYLDAGVSVLFFPEGTRSRDGQVKEFKAGAFRLALEAGVDVLPLGIGGTADALPTDTWKFSSRPSNMRLLVGSPISTADLTERDLPELIAKARASVMLLKQELDTRSVESTRPATPRARLTA